MSIPARSVLLGRILPCHKVRSQPGRLGSLLGWLYTACVRQRWFSRRALLLHLEVVVIAPGCLVAGWWQATVALAGNALSWVYTVEWPVFAIIAVGAWWHLIHEDPEVYKARKHPSPDWETTED